MARNLAEMILVLAVSSILLLLPEAEAAAVERNGSPKFKDYHLVVFPRDRAKALTEGPVAIHRYHTKRSCKIAGEYYLRHIVDSTHASACVQYSILWRES